MTDAERCKGGLSTIVTFLAAVVSVLLALTLFGSEAPTGELSAFFHSRKVERGMTENRNPVCGFEAEAEWRWVFAGAECLLDMTGTRAWLYNEITPFAGCRLAPVNWLELEAAYRFKQEPGEHTHELEAEARFPLPWCVPFVGANVDMGEAPGALYGVLGVSGGVPVFDGVELVPEVGMGFGNARRNDADFGCRRDAAMDIHTGISVEWEICPSVRLCPYVMLYDQFTADGRREGSGNGFFCVSGCAVKCEF